jgi:hypothetical protein
MLSAAYAECRSATTRPNSLYFFLYFLPKVNLNKYIAFYDSFKDEKNVLLTLSDVN